MADVASDRLSDLEALLTWEGRLQNARVRDLFGVSYPRASQLIADFRHRRPGLSEWDTKARAYLSARRAKDRPPLERYLNLIGYDPAAPASSRADATLTEAYRDHWQPDPVVFATLRRAIEQGDWLALTYRSMREPAPHQHVVRPQTLVRAGRRWHVRAYSLQRAEFRDLVLGRISQVASVNEIPEVTIPKDEAWDTKVTAKLIAHPNLSRAQAAVIQQEWGDRESLMEATRAALLPYLLQVLGAAVRPDKQRPPEYQIALANAAELRPWLWP